MVKKSDIRAIDASSESRGADDDDVDARSDVSGSEAAESYTSRSISSNRTGNKESSVLEEAIPLLARGETQAVKRLRWLTIGVLLLVAGICCAAVFIFTRNVETDSFSEEFTSSGLKVIQAFQDDSYRKLDALHSLSNTLTAYAVDGNLTWPFVTLNSSAHVIDPYLSLAGAAAITILPLVPADQRAEWEAYSVTNQGWIQHDYIVHQKEHIKKNGTKAVHHRQLQASEASAEHSLQAEKAGVDSISPYIKNYVGIDLSPGPWFVWWQYAPVITNTYFVNFNRMATKGFTDMAQSLYEGFAVISNTFTIVPGLDVQSSSDYFFVNEMLQEGREGGSYGVGEPLSYIYYPVFQNFDNNTLVAGLESMVYWRSYFEFVLPDKVHGIIVVVKNTNGESFTYQINGKEAVFLGLEDNHAAKYENMMLRADYTSFQDKSVEADSNRNYQGVLVDDAHMSYWIEVYPSEEMEEIYLTSRPLIYTLAMVFFFTLTTSIFLLYDWYVERRQRIVLSSALKSNAVIANMFPANVRDRLLANASGGGNKLEEFALDEKEGLIPTSSRVLPIADFYPETTVYFADVRGFTAWASTREPVQVFQLLESIYNSFDEIAKRRRVFKVETVGDCYVAVTGLPDPQANHAVIMARFARDCTTKFNQLVRKLETTLGPDTAELALRTGLHSGPVTGGVIRGENARFQLFGDTVNTAARMESTGSPGRIQLSQETADLIISQGKARWLIARDDEVMAKGKGVLRTFWLIMSESAAGSSQAQSLGSSEDTATEDESNLDEEVAMSRDLLMKAQFDEKTTRLVSWNVDLLTNLLLGVQAARRERGSAKSKDFGKLEQNFKRAMIAVDKRTIEEVCDVIHLPEFDSKVASAQKHASSMKLDPRVTDQLYSYVQCLAAMYRPNPFHNFEHASHVTMSVSKLLSRIVKPANLEQGSKLTHDHTYGITSDPTVHFSVVLAALIHDVDHNGVPNAQLVKEGTKLAEFYHGKSVAEQNSVDLAWELLMDESYAELRAAIYSNEQELIRFRSLIVNTVMATDIVDKDLKALRDARWEKAFSESAVGSCSKTDVDRKATIVIEHLIQASDVAHTMQHWHIYRKWNERFFMECYKAFKEGRAEKDPSDFWYKGEIGFFDFYIIPLAKKLKDCGVFGVSSDEYLSYALRNRKEWESKGQAVVAEMISNANQLLAKEAQVAPPAEDKPIISRKRLSVRINPLNMIKDREAAISSAAISEEADEAELISNAGKVLAEQGKDTLAKDKPISPRKRLSDKISPLGPVVEAEREAKPVTAISEEALFVVDEFHPDRLFL